MNMPQRITVKQRPQDKVEKWTALVDRNIQRYYKNPTALNFTIWEKSLDKLVSMERLYKIKGPNWEELRMIEHNIYHREMWYNADHSDDLLFESVVYWHERRDDWYYKREFNT